MSEASKSSNAAASSPGPSKLLKWDFYNQTNGPYLPYLKIKVYLDCPPSGKLPFATSEMVLTASQTWLKLKV